MRQFVALSLIIASVIHLLPLIGVISAARLSTMYGIPVAEPNLEILLRHRAVLFGLVGTFLLYGAFCVALQTAAFVVGIVSVVSFLALIWSVGNYNGQLRKVALVDIVALVFLIAGSVVHALA